MSCSSDSQIGCLSGLDIEEGVMFRILDQRQRNEKQNEREGRKCSTVLLPWEVLEILQKTGALEDQIGRFRTTTKLSCIAVKLLQSRKLSFSYWKCLGPESLQISDFFRF